MAEKKSKNTSNVEIECDIPTDLPNFTCIQYPGQVNNINNAIETLGGHQKIQETFSKYNQFKQQQKIKKKQNNKSHKEPYLELHLNPNGVFDHALFGKIQPVKNCILIKKTTKIRKKKSRKRKHDEISTDNDENKRNDDNKPSSTSTIQVLGRITSLVTYDGLADFQVFTDLKYPQKIMNNNHNNNNNHNDNNNNIIKKGNKRRRVWSLREDDIPNISQYPLVPSVFAAKPQPIDGFIKDQKKKSMTTTKDEQSLETKPTEIKFHKKDVPKQPKNKTIWKKYIDELNEYVSDINNRKIPNNDEFNKIDIKNINTKHSFCQKIRNELILQIKSYFEIQPIWSQNEILLQKFYIYWYHIKYFADRIEVSHQNQNNKNNKNNKNDENDTFYDFDIASIIFERKKSTKNYYLSSLNSTNTSSSKSSQHHHHDRLIQISPTGTHFDLDNKEKIYLDYKEKEKIICKFLGVVGYKFASGPFRQSYIKFGFDPRLKDNKNRSRPLQIYDFRLNKIYARKLEIDTIWSNTGSRVQARGRPTASRITQSVSMTSIMDNQQINTETKSIRNERFLAQEMIDDDDINDNDKIEKEMMNKLCFNKVPNKLQTIYRLKNIDIKEIKDIINNSDPNSYNQECDKVNGWILATDYKQIKVLMNERVKKWVEIEKQKSKNSSPTKKNKNGKKKKENESESIDINDISSIITTPMSTRTISREGTGSSSPNINEVDDEKAMELDYDTFDGDNDGDYNDGDDTFELL